MTMYLLRSVRNAEIGLIPLSPDELKLKNEHFGGSVHFVILVISAKIVQTTKKFVIAIKFRWLTDVNGSGI